MPNEIAADQTEVGNYFISNYPPFSFWSKDSITAIEEALARPAETAAPLGLYLHIPFCRKRCKFCYFKVYTDVNAATIQAYVDALAKEVELVAAKPAVSGRQIEFVYFGGGTPSYLSARQIEGLVEQLHRSIHWDRAREVTFECEPGTLQEPKVKALKGIGVTRLSLGVESFNDAILEENGRAHLSPEIHRAWAWIKAADFDQVNIDLIAGMVGESWDTWHDNIRQTIQLDPDSVTIYQMELPFNTTYSKSLLILGQQTSVDVAPWSVKRKWLEFASDELQAAGYKVSSAYTFVKTRGRNQGFHYRDHLWRGADLLGTGVASFGHLSGVHYQNIDKIEVYEAILAEGKLPLGRAMRVSPRELLIRELILQTKLGWIDPGYFRSKFGVDILDEFRDVYAGLEAEGFLTARPERIALTRDGLLRVDSLLPRFYLPQHQSARYA
jgi:oxygen-independent coproporphyrinogen-3 oxidase